MLNYRPWISTGANGSVKIRLQSTLSPTSTQRFLANQTPTLRFSALLNEEVADAELALNDGVLATSPLVRERSKAECYAAPFPCLTRCYHGYNG